MNYRKPEPKDFPPESPHDLEWGGYNHTKYQIALAQWEAAQLRQTSSFFSRQDIGGEDPEKFRLHLQIANLKSQNSSLLEALKECEEYFFNMADADYDETNPIPNKEMRMLTMIKNAIKKAEQ